MLLLEQQKIYMLHLNQNVYALLEPKIYMLYLNKNIYAMLEQKQRKEEYRKQRTQMFEKY